MKNKGFTLIELLATLIVLGILIAIIFPNITSILNKQRQKLYNQQIAEIEKAAKGWGSKNTMLLPNKENPNAIYININTLVSEEYLKKGDILDPRDDTKLLGCVGIAYDLNYNQFVYSFINVNDKSYNNECDGAI